MHTLMRERVGGNQKADACRLIKFVSGSLCQIENNGHLPRKNGKRFWSFSVYEKSMFPHISQNTKTSTNT